MRNTFRDAALLAGNYSYLEKLVENTVVDTEDVEDTLFSASDDTEEIVGGGDEYQIDVTVDLNDGEWDFEEFTSGLSELITDAEFLDPESGEPFAKNYSIDSVEIEEADDGEGKFSINIKGSGEGLDDFVNTLVNDILTQDAEQENGDVSVSAELVSSDESSDDDLEQAEIEDGLEDDDLEDGEDDGEIELTFEAIINGNDSMQYFYGDDTLRVLHDSYLGVSTTKVIKESNSKVIGSIVVNHNKGEAKASFTEGLDYHSVDFLPAVSLGRMIVEAVTSKPEVIEGRLRVGEEVLDFEVRKQNNSDEILVYRDKSAPNSVIAYALLDHSKETATGLDGVELPYLEIITKGSYESIAEWLAFQAENATAELDDEEIDTSVDEEEEEIDLDIEDGGEDYSIETVKLHPFSFEGDDYSISIVSPDEQYDFVREGGEGGECFKVAIDIDGVERDVAALTVDVDGGKIFAYDLLGGTEEQIGEYDFNDFGLDRDNFSLEDLEEPATKVIDSVRKKVQNM